MQLYLETQRILQEIEEKKLIGIVLAGVPTMQTLRSTTASPI